MDILITLALVFMVWMCIDCMHRKEHFIWIIIMVVGSIDVSPLRNTEKRACMGGVRPRAHPFFGSRPDWLSGYIIILDQVGGF